VRSCGTLLLLAAFFCLGGLSRAEAPCEPSLEIVRDGSISEWDVCQNGKAINVTDSDSDFLQLEMAFGDDVQELALDWASPLAKADRVTTVGTDNRTQIKIARTYRQVSSSELDHTIRISGLSKASIPQVRLRLGHGPIESSESRLRTTFADFVYGFRRAYMSKDGQTWFLADAGEQSDRIAISSRHKVLIVESSAGLELLASGITLSPDSAETTNELIYRQRLIALDMQTPNLAAVGYDGLMFVDLWGPLAALSKWIEAFLIGVSRKAGGVGPAIIILAIVIRFVTYPVSLWAARKQHEYSIVAERINPLIADIKDKYKGAEQSERILAVYGENKISPFSGLKGSIGLFVQIPFLLAVFNVTTSSSIFADESFLWIANLSQADRAFWLSFYIPFLGNSVNALPLILGAVNIGFADRTSGATSSAKWTPIIISLLIVLVFYSFCAAVVLYWLTVNILQVAERQLQTRFDWLSKKEGSVAA
jgi:YidC/Oxa1 family membrane protein insertase